MTPWQRLARGTIWVAPLRPLGGLLATALVVVTFRGWDRLGFVEPLVGLGVAIAAFVVSFWYWSTTTYRITDANVELRSGLLVRRHRSVARDRLRSVDITADAVHRVVGLAVVTVGTGRQGGKEDDELTLDALRRTEAERLRTVLLRRPAPASAPAVDGVPEPDETIARFDPAWLLLAPFSLMGLVAVTVVSGALAQLVRTVGGDEVWESERVDALVDRVAAVPTLVLVAVAIVALLVANAVASPVLYLLVYGGYRLTRENGSLRVSYGLVTHRSVTIEERRIRGVALVEPLLLQLVRAGRLTVVAAGLTVKEKKHHHEHPHGNLLLPNAPRAVADRVAAQVLTTRSSPLRVPLRRSPPAALRVLAIRWSVFALPAVVLGVLAGFDLLPSRPWELALGLVLVGVAGAVLEYRNLGHARVGEYLVARSGAGVRHTAAVQCDGIIAWRFHRTVFQRRPRLLTATAAVAAGKGVHVIRYADQDVVLPVAAAATPGLLTPFLEPEPEPVRRAQPRNAETTA